MKDKKEIVKSKIEIYKIKIRTKYQIDYREKAYTFNRGYIMGLVDSKIISTSEGFELIDLNGLLRRKPK